MSQFIGAARPTAIIEEDDRRILPIWMARGVLEVGPAVSINWYDLGQNYTNVFWPRGNFFVGDPALDVGLLEAAWYEEPDFPSGGSSRFVFVGVARDVYGSPIPFALVYCYRTSTHEMVSVIAADGNGIFVAMSPYFPDTHYLRAYKIGTPDVMGTTVDTLVGA